MFAAYGARTAANAKPKERSEQPHVVDLAALRRQRALLRSDTNAQKKRIEEQRAIIAKEKAIADEMIAKARAASQAIRAREREVARAALQRKIDALETEMQVLGEIEAAQRYSTPFKAIERRLCKALNVRAADVYGNRGDRKIVFARQAIAYWALRLTGFSTPQIGRIMNRDHTTIVHAKQAYREKRAASGRHLRKI